MADDFVGSLAAFQAVKDDRLSSGVHERAKGGAFFLETALKRPGSHVKRRRNGLDPAVSLRKQTLDAVANAVEEAIVRMPRVKPSRDAAKLAVEQLIAMREAEVPRSVADQQRVAALSKEHRRPKRAAVLLYAAPVGMLEVDLFHDKRTVGGKPKQLRQDRCEELDLVHQHRKLVLDPVDMNGVVLGVLPESDDAAVREKLLKANACGEPFAKRFRAQKQQKDQVVYSGFPYLGSAQAEESITALGESCSPEAARGIAGWATGSVQEDLDIDADRGAERVDVEPQPPKRIHDALCPGPGHPGRGLPLCLLRCSLQDQRWIHTEVEISSRMGESPKNVAY